ncbi:MAG: hypothetical protein C4529_13930 [Deltaproteobacteria bacterium]|nr:MAG: hypothetical protein C4529_13930 [Deltaproteobacteria bacterium]
MPKYRVLDMHIRHGVGKEVRELTPGSIVELTAEEAARIGKTIEPVPSEEGEGAPATVQETIKKIAAAETVDAVKALIVGNIVKKIQTAAEKRIAELEKA